MEYLVRFRLPKATDAAGGRPVDTHCVILDFSGLKWSHLTSTCIKMVKALAAIYQDNYPVRPLPFSCLTPRQIHACAWKHFL